MGTGSLTRIAALSLLATTAVLAGGAVSVPAQLTVPGTTVTAPAPTVAAPSTTVRVPSTTTKVTTPPITLTTPKQTVKPPSVKAPAPKPTPTAAVSEPVETITKTVSGAPSTGSAGDTVQKTIDAVPTVGGTSNGSSGGRTIGGTASAPGEMTYVSGPGGGGGGTTGRPGGILGSGSGGGFGGSSSASGGSLAAMLAGASSKELRSVLEQLEGCLPALPGADRRVISLRAGLDGAPMNRAQVGQRLGLSPNAVRNTERRALNRLQFAAANTGCAASVVGPFDPTGIGNLSPQLALAGGAAGDFAQARGIVGQQSASPLFDLGAGGQGGPAWAIVLFTVLLSVSIAALTREVRQSF